MNELPSRADFSQIGRGFDANPARSFSLRAEAYTDPRWFEADLKSIIAKSWQWVCHIERV